MSFLLKLWQPKSSPFEQLLEEVTSPTTHSSHHKLVNEVVRVLSGGNPQIHPQLAFTILTSRLTKSPFRHHWTFQLKNLLLLSLCVDEHLFCRDIGGYSQTLMDHLPPSHLQEVDTRKVLKLFWRITKHRAQFVASESHVLGYSRRSRAEFLHQLSSMQVLGEMSTIESFFKVCFELIGQLRGCSNNKNSLLTELIQHLLSKCYQLYACQLQCFEQILGKIKFWGQGELQKLKKTSLKFETNSLHLMKLFQHYGKTDGFEGIDYTELNPFASMKMPQLIDQLLEETNKNPSEYICPLSPEQLEPIVVSIKSFSPLKRANTTPRISLSVELSLTSSEVDPFCAWDSSFSQEFPPKEMLSKELEDLLDTLKEEKDSQIVYDISTSGLGSPSFGSEIEEGCEDVEYMASVRYESSVEWAPARQVLEFHPFVDSTVPRFQNLYSGLSSKWNA